MIHAQGEDSKKGQLIYLTRKGSFQVILYKMIRFLSGKLKKDTKLAKIVKISEIFNRLVFPLNFNRFCHPMTKNLSGGTQGILKQNFWSGSLACLCITDSLSHTTYVETKNRLPNVLQLITFITFKLSALFRL